MVTWADGTQAVCAIVTVVVAVIAAGYAALQWREARTSRTDATSAEIERLQPQVAVYLEPGEPSTHNVYLVVHNYGPTTARKVRVEFDAPVPQRAIVEEGDYREVTVPDLPVLAPGQEWRTLFDNGAERAAKPDMVNAFSGWVFYEGTVKSSEGAFARYQHKESVELDYGVFKYVLYSGGPGSLREVAKAVEDVAEAIENKN